MKEKSSMNKMGVEPVGRLMITMGIPMILSMMLQSTGRTTLSTIAQVAGAIGLQLFAGQIIGIFDVSEEVKILSIRAIRIITLGYLFVGANVAFQGIFQALGNGFLSLAVSLARQIVIALPLACALTRLSNAGDMIWMAFPAAEAGGLIAAIAAMIFVRKSRLKEMNMQPEWE